MAQFEPMSTMRRAVLPRLGRVATSAAIALALGCGVAPLAATVAPAFAWAEETAQTEDVNKASELAADAANTGDEPAAAAEATALTPRGRWTFNKEGNATENTGSETGLTLTFTGAGAKVQNSNIKALGKIARFDSKDTDYDVRVPGVINLQDDYSIGLWIKADPGSEKTNILQLSGDNGRTILYQEAGGNYGTYIDGQHNRTFAEKNPGRNTWHHLLFVKDKDAMKATLYINGEFAGETTWTVPLQGGTSAALIFGEHKNQANSDAKRFQGNMDELCIYGGALTPEQAKAVYDGYSDVKTELEAVNARQELTTLIQKGKDLLQQDDGQNAYDALKQAIDAAEALGDAPTADEISKAKSDIENAIGAVFALGIVVDVDPTSAAIKTVDGGIFGINHRYAFNGYGSFDPVAGKVRDTFADLYDEANFGSIRYPGGTISNLFNWKETLDKIDENGTEQERTNQIHGFYKRQNGIAPNFGISEIATFADEHDSEIIYVYALGRGSAADAADLVEFLNAEVGSNPNGGTEWAKVRELNGHADPYNVRYFEIGNEMNQGGKAGEGTTSQQYWTAFVEGKGALDAYIEGGVANFTGNDSQRAIKRGDWNEQKAFTTSEPNQEFGLPYANVPLDPKSDDYASFKAIEEDGLKVTVGGETWNRVDDLKTQNGEAKVYQIDWKTGYFKFGDGTNGKIPTAGQEVKVSYKVKRDGFNAISKSMRDTMKQINDYRGKNGITLGEIHVYSSFENNEFFSKMAKAGKNDLYDGMTIHPYSGGPTDDSGLQNEAFYLRAMELGNSSVEHVRSLTETMRRHGGKDKVPVISEYGIFRSTNTQVRSQAHALYIARQIMEFIKLGSPYIQKHCLVDWYSNGGDALGPTQQAVIQAVPGAGASTDTGDGPFTYFKTPSALTFELYNGTDEKAGFGTEILDSTTTGSFTLDNGVKVYDVLPSRDADGNIFVAVTNLDITKPGAITLRLKGVDLTGRKLEVRTFSGDAYNSENTPDKPSNVDINAYEVTADTANPKIELDPHSFTIVKVLAEQPPAQHTVTFKVDDKVWDTKTVTEGLLVEAPAEPSKDGFRFTGWTLNGAPFDILKTPITGSITLVAAFEKIDEPAPDPVAEHTVTFMVDGKVHHTATVKDGELVTPPANPVKDGYTFSAWTLDGKPFDFDMPIIGDVTLEASFTKDAPEPSKPVEPGKPGNPGTKPGGGLPSTGDPAVIAAALAVAGSGVALAGTYLRRRR